MCPVEKLDKLSHLKSAAKSGNPELIEHALAEIRDRGDHTYIAPLVAFIHQSPPREVKQKIYQLFVDLKQESSVEPLMAEVQNEKDPDVLQSLLACCWQNGLNYSKYLPYFVQLVIDEEFLVAFEAFTVIENMYGKIDREVEVSLVAKVEASLRQADGQKQHLLKALLEIIPNIPLDQEPVDF